MKQNPEQQNLSGYLNAKCVFQIFIYEDISKKNNYLMTISSPWRNLISILLYR